MTIFAKLFNLKPTGDDSMTELEKIDVEIAEARQKLESAETAIEAAESAYKAALTAGDDAEALSHLEAKAAAERLQKLHSDRLPLLLERRPFVARDAAEPEIRQACTEVQEMCDQEAKLIDRFHDLERDLKAMSQQVSDHGMATNAALGRLMDRIRAAGGPSHQGVRRAPRFTQDTDTLLTIARSYHPWPVGSIPEHKAPTPEEAARQAIRDRELEEERARRLKDARIPRTLAR